jgi:hypothetical protein
MSVFQCAIDECGMSNLITLLEFDKQYAANGSNQFAERYMGGNLSTLAGAPMSDSIVIH